MWLKVTGKETDVADPGPGPCFRPVTLGEAAGAAKRLRGVLSPEGDRPQLPGPLEVSPFLEEEDGAW